MRRLSLTLGDRSYPILIGGGLLVRADLILPFLRTPRVALVSNTTVAPLYLDSLVGGLEKVGVDRSGVGYVEVAGGQEDHAGHCAENSLGHECAPQKEMRRDEMNTAGAGICSEM